MARTMREVTLSSNERALKAWMLRKQGMLLREIGVAIGRLDDGSPLTIEGARALCAKGERVEKRRSGFKPNRTKGSEDK